MREVDDSNHDAGTSGSTPNGGAEQGSLDAVVRRHYVVAFRDELPLPSGGWRVVRHGPQCHDDSDDGD